MSRKDLRAQDCLRVKEPLETVMTREVKALYFRTIGEITTFDREDYLDMAFFKRHFASVAHKHGIFHHEERHQYNLFFRFVLGKMKVAIKRMTCKEPSNRKKKSPIATPLRSVPVSNVIPTDEQLFLFDDNLDQKERTTQAGRAKLERVMKELRMKPEGSAQ